VTPALTGLTVQKARAANGDGKAVVITAPVGIAAIVNIFQLALRGARWRLLSQATDLGSRAKLANNGESAVARTSPPASDVRPRKVARGEFVRQF